MTIRRNKQSESIENQVILGALLGVDVIAVIEMLGLSVLDIPLKIALYCFASAIPTLATQMANLVVSSRYEREILTWYNALASIGGILASLIGINMLFWHFSKRAGILFATLATLGVISYFHYHFKMIALNRPNKE